MPQMPAFLADRLTPVFAKASVVEEVETLAPALRRVRFGGEALRSVRFVPAHEVEFRVDARSFRHYTVSDWHAGGFDVLFHLHGHGPGSAWAAGLREGDAAALLGPGGTRLALRQAPVHVMLGDETCLGLFRGLVRALPAHQRALGALETDEGELVAASSVGLDAALREGRARGEALRHWLARCTLPVGAAYYLAGHAATILALRRELEARGVSRRVIHTQPYWADGKRGL